MRALIYMVIAILITSCASTSFAFDLDNDGREGLAESILALQVVAGIATPAFVNCTAPDEIESTGLSWKDRNLGASEPVTTFCIYLNAIMAISTNG